MDLYLRYGPALVRKARRILSNDDDARDVVQALFIDLLQKGTEAVDLPYLYRAITHRCLNVLRDSRNRARIVSGEADHLAPRASELFAETLSFGRRALALLASRVDDDVMEALVLRHLDEMGVEEIAQLLGVSRKTVFLRLKRAEEAVAEMRARGEA